MSQSSEFENRVTKKQGRNYSLYVITLVLLTFDMKPSRAQYIRALATYKIINSVIGNKSNLIMVISIPKLGPS